jgi:uncharacterized membrane protein
VGVLSAWASTASEDVSLLTGAYLPEFLLVTVLVVLILAIRRLFSRDRRSVR